MGIIGNNISNIYVGDYPDAGVFGASYLLFIFAWMLVVQGIRKHWLEKFTT